MTRCPCGRPKNPHASVCAGCKSARKTKKQHPPYANGHKVGPKWNLRRAARTREATAV